ncbi:MAG TPA: hypothetical protein DF480_03025 [Clostridiales bacterium]|jgi:succinyl-diaminopimelate desuccinylase|nr:hypothetical protein [Clostridiales bacterium]
MNDGFDTLTLDIARKFTPVLPGIPGIRFRSLKGGQAPQAMPEEAKLLLMAPDYIDIRQRIAAYKKETGDDVDHRTRGKSLEISARSGGPEEERNAISILIELAGSLPFAGDEIKDFFDFYNTYIHFETNGAALGLAFSDPASGPLILNAGMIEMTPEAARLTLGICCPSSCPEEQICDAMMPILNRYEMGLVKPSHQDPATFG